MSAKKEAGAPSRGAAGTTAREDGLGSRELATIGETAITAAAAQATAAVQARYMMAARFPRDYDQARVTLLAECNRPTFADSAIWELEHLKDRRGRPLQGPSIRLAEAAIRAMRNILTEVSTIYDDAEKRILRVSVTDLEGNVPYTQEIVVDKTVERRQLRDGQVALSQRKNTQGQTVYRVEATETDLAAKQGALVSKVLRTLALRLVPGDLVDEALEACQATLERGIKDDPEGNRKKLADAFASIGVQPAALKEFLGHDLASCSPHEIRELRGTFTAIRDGATTWAETIAQKKADRAERSDQAPATTATASAPASTTPPPPAEPARTKTVAEIKAEELAKRQAKPAEGAPGAKP